MTHRPGPNPSHTLYERCHWLTLKNSLYRQQAAEFRKLLQDRGGVGAPPLHWTDEECREFLDFAKVAPHLRNPY